MRVASYSYPSDRPVAPRQRPAQVKCLNGGKQGDHAMKHRFSAFAGLFVVGLLTGLLAGLPAQAQQAAGQVERQKGTASRSAADGTVALAQGARVYVGDEISTGPGARLLIRFDDESMLTLGEEARITIDQLLYSPGGESNQALAIAKGVFRFATGQISKLAPLNVAVTTPVATIGIRGTVFLGGELTVGMPPGQPHYGFQITEGAIEVTSPAGSVVLDEPGEGTFLPLTRVAAPTPVRQWTAEEAAEAEAALAF
jgi:FecR protein